MYKSQFSLLFLAVLGHHQHCLFRAGVDVDRSVISRWCRAAITAEHKAGTWSLTALQRAGEPSQPAPPNATYTLTVTADLASARADCNQCSGALAVSGQIVTIGPALAVPAQRARPWAFESAYTAILGGDSTALLEGNRCFGHRLLVGWISRS
jgi:heat shock protein HslJ